MIFSFTVPGKPATQGSKDQFGRESCKRLALWRADARLLAERARPAGWDPAAPVQVNATFTFARPKSHYRTGKHADQLKPQAPVRCTNRVDVDKLARALLDAITGPVVLDDSQVVILTAAKHWSADGTESTSATDCPHCDGLKPGNGRHDRHQPELNTELRAQAFAKIIANGGRRSDCIHHAAEHWGVGARSCVKYLEMARLATEEQIGILKDHKWSQTCSRNVQLFRLKHAGWPISHRTRRHQHCRQARADLLLSILAAVAGGSVLGSPVVTEGLVDPAGVQPLKDRINADLLPAQQEFIDDEDHRILGYVGGFGSGKTFALAAKILYMGMANPGATLMALEPTFPMLRTVLFPTFDACFEQWEVPFTFRVSPPA